MVQWIIILYRSIIDRVLQHAWRVEVTVHHISSLHLSACPDKCTVCTYETDHTECVATKCDTGYIESGDSLSCLGKHTSHLFKS